MHVVDLQLNKKYLEDQISILLNPMREVTNLLNVKFDEEVAHYLYQQLFSPTIKYLNGKTRLIIIPDGVLHYLPFELLVTSGMEKRNPDDDDWYSEYSEIQFLIHNILRAKSGGELLSAERLQLDQAKSLCNIILS